jgi:tetratricopeptide (TPR) repeat protein
LPILKAFASKNKGNLHIIDNQNKENRRLRRAAASYNLPAYNTPAYNVPTYNQNTISQNATNWLNEANVFYLTGSYQQAAESYAKAVNADPSLSEGWLNLGNSLYFLGRYQASLNAYDALLNLEPNNANALAGKNKTLLALNTTIVPNSTIGVPSSV